MKGRFHGLSRDIDGGLIVSFRVYEEKKALEEVERIREEKTLTLTAKKIVKKRSLSANAYYWTLCSKLAGVLNISVDRCHNIMLRRYGTPQTIDGETVCVFVPDTEKAFNAALEAETYHLKPTSAVKVFKDGEPRRMYRLLKGSHEYNTEEMTKLINGLVDECKAVGIETLTPREIADMMKEVKRREKHHSTE